MKVRLKQFRYGPGVYQEAGSTIEVSDDEASDLVKFGRAELIETATKAPARNAARRSKRKASK